MTDVPKTQADLRDMVYHTDARVSAMESQLASVADAMNRLEQHLLNKPEKWNSGSIIALLSLVASIVIGGSVFLDSQLSHVKDDIVELTAEAKVNQEFRHQMHFEVGVMKHSFEVNDEKWQHFDMLMHQRDDRINGVENRQLGMSEKLKTIAKLQEKFTERALTGLEKRRDG